MPARSNVPVHPTPDVSTDAVIGVGTSLDGRNALDRDRVERAGVTYVGLGR
jgi:hypothetical protein